MSRVSILSKALFSAATVGILWGCFACWSLWSYGSLRDGVRVASGTLIVVADPVAKLGLVSRDGPISANFELKNLSSRPVTVLGAELDCTCVSISSVPVTLNGGERALVTISITADELTPGEEFYHQAVLNFDTDHPSVVLTVIGTVD